MTEIAQRYRRLADAFAARVAAVPADKWAAPTPCEAWTARELVAHMVQTQGMFLGFVGEQLGDIPSVDDDPAAAWNGARTVVQDKLEDPVVAGKEFDGLTGRSSFEAAVDRFLSFDLVVHGWDLARATGLDDRIEPEDVDRVWRQAREMSVSFGDRMRGPGAFGPEVEAPPGADEQGKLLAFLGRQP